MQLTKATLQQWIDESKFPENKGWHRWFIIRNIAMSNNLSDREKMYWLKKAIESK